MAMIVVARTIVLGRCITRKLLLELGRMKFGFAFYLLTESIDNVVSINIVMAAAVFDEQ